MGWPSDHLRFGRNLNVKVSWSAEMVGGPEASIGMLSPLALMDCSPSNIRTIICVDDVSPEFSTAKLEMSLIVPSISLPPLTGVRDVLGAGLQHACRKSTILALQAA